MKIYVNIRRTQIRSLKSYFNNLTRDDEKKLYLAQCVAIGGSYSCITGNSQLDIQVFGTDTFLQLQNRDLTAIQNHILIINPQKSDSKGDYSIYVPDGAYYVKTVSPSYKEFVSKPIVQLGKAVRLDIFLEKN
jgi:hypothetical protein